MTPLLEVAGLTVGFAGVTALDSLDLSLEAGELRCAIGPNGAGKSSLLKCLSGQLRPDAGRIRLAGRDVTGRSVDALARAGVGLKTQVPNLFESLTVSEHCRLAARGRVDDGLLARFGLANRAGRPVRELSHGERQLAELAAVLAARPRLLLLDEPAAGLSAEEAGLVAAALRGSAGGATVIVVEHDLRFVAALGCPVTVLHRGRVLAHGSFESVMAEPSVRTAYFGRAVYCGHNGAGERAGACSK